MRNNNEIIFSFKEKDKEQYLFKDNAWVKCNEEEIDRLWSIWVVSQNTYRGWDDEGFLVFGNFKIN